MTPRSASRVSPSTPSRAHAMREKPSRAASAASSTPATGRVRPSRNAVASASRASCSDVERLKHARRRLGDVAGELDATGAADERDLALGEVPRTKFHPCWDTLELPVDDPPTEGDIDAVVQLHAHPAVGQLGPQLPRALGRSRP